MTDSEDAQLGGDDGAGRQLIGMFLKDADARSALLAGSEIHQPQDSAVRDPAVEDKLPEIFIERYQDSLVLTGTAKDGFVTRVLGPVTRPHHFVARGLQFSLRSWGEAAIEEKLQEAASMERGSMRSLAVIRRA